MADDTAAPTADDASAPTEAMPPARPPPPQVSSGSTAWASEDSDEVVWTPDPNVAYASPAVRWGENGVIRNATAAEWAAFSPPMTLAQAQVAKLAEMQAAGVAAGQVAFAFDFGQTATLNDDGSAGPAAGVKHLQMGDDDQDNWKAVMPVALAAIMAQSSSPFPIRTQENVTVLPTPQQVVTCLTAAFARNSAYVVSTLPKLKLQIAAAASLADVAAVTWPGS